MRVSVVVPAFDEEAVLAEHLAAIDSYCAAAQLDHELIVVDDGSTDRTRAIAEAFARGRSHVHVVALDENRGLGGALRAGFEVASAPVVVTLDADLTYSPDHVERLAAACEDPVAVVVASPYAPGGRVSGVPRHRLVLSRWANRLLARRIGLATSTSMVRAYDRKFLDSTLSTLPDRDLLLGLLRSARAGGRVIAEIPAHLDWSAVPERRSRMRMSDSVAAVVRAWRRA